MNNPLASRKIQILAGLIIVAAAATIGLVKARPTHHVSSTSTTNMPSYTYQGQLPTSEIHGQQATIVTRKGNITFTLDDAQSPIAVSNFIYLAKAGYYNGILWHRVENWVVQMGDPQTKNPSSSSAQWGSGGPGYTIPDEPVTGEYVAGVVAMAKTSAPNSAGSQIFILKQDTPLPKTYQIIGRVTSGQDVVNNLAVGDQVQSVTIAAAK